jgi:hypothetical protein
MELSANTTLKHILEANDKILVELRILNKLMDSLVSKGHYTSNALKVTGL